MAAERSTLIEKHIGVDEPNDVARTGWKVLRPYLMPAKAWVFSRQAYVWDGLDANRVHVIPPCIDAFSSKNLELGADELDAILSVTAICESRNVPLQQARHEERASAVKRPVRMNGAQLQANAKIVLQVSRWDRLKDPLGVMESFARHVVGPTAAYLILAGPAATSVRDDPEQPEVLAELESRCAGLEPDVRARVRIAQLPMEDEHENALIVNALQRRADVVVQKSFAEGFGLTVSEAMWKSRPVVASRVGGIQDQIEHGKSGILVEPDELEEFALAVVDLLGDSSKAEQLGARARARVASTFLVPCHMLAQGKLISSLLSSRQ